MKSGLRAAILTGLAVACFALLFALTPAADRLENQYALGLLYGLRGSLSPPDGAVIIALDDRTIAWLRESAADPGSHAGLACMPPGERRQLSQIRGPSSLPRSVLACLLNRLKEVGFPVVAFDILFALPGSEDDDAVFAQSLEAHGAVAILTGLERSTVRDGLTELLVEREVQPLPLFQHAAAATGMFLVPKSGGPVYGYLKKAPGFEDTPSLPSQVRKLSGHYLGSDPPETAEPAFEYLWLYGPPGSIRTISAHDILSGDDSDALGSIAASTVAFVGASDPQASDYPDSFPAFFRSGIGTDISGVELLATAFLNAEANEVLRRVSPVQGAVLTMLFAFALGFLARARSGLALIAAPAAGLLYAAGAAMVFSRTYLLAPVATPVFVVAPAAFVVAVFIRYRFARALIMRLAPATAARRMLMKPTDHRGTAVAHDATIAFFDLIGSTAIAEKIAPVDFNALLNAYFDSAVDIVERQRGQISAFSGDGITAVFVGSHNRQNHAVRACAAVIDVIGAMQRVSAENAQAGLPPLHLRVGLNSGNVAEGEIGARDRFNFSVVGDVVNLASRLEQMGKTLFPGEKDVVLVGEATQAMAASEPALVFRDCGLCEIRGRERQERIFRLAVERSVA